MSPPVARPCVWLFVLLVMMLTAACDQKDLEIPGGEMCTVDVSFSWTRAKDASPEGMSVFFYPQSRGGQFWRFDIAGRDGGLVEIPEGTYTMLAVNNDLPGVMLEDMTDLSSAQAVQAVSAKDSSLFPAGMLYRARVSDLTVGQRGISYLSDSGDMIHSASRELTCSLDSASVVYNLIFRNVDGLDKVKSAGASLSGCGGGIYLSSMKSFATADPLPVELEPDPEGRSLCGSSTGFLCDHPASGYELTLRVRYYDGGVIEKKLRITAESVNTSDSHSVYIVIKDMRLPENAPLDPDAVGIGVGMDGWNTIEIDLES